MSRPSLSPSLSVSPDASLRTTSHGALPSGGMTWILALGAGIAAAVAAKRQMTYERMESTSRKPKRAGFFKGVKAGGWQGLATNYPGVQEVLQAGVGDPTPTTKPFGGLKRPGRGRHNRRGEFSETASFSSCESHDARHLHNDVPTRVLRERGIRTGRKTR